MNKYELIAQDLRQRFSRDDFAPGDRLPTTVELCAAYGVSRITIRRAMDELESEGYIARRRGAGTFFKGNGPKGQDAGRDGLPHLWGASAPTRPADDDKRLAQVHEFAVVRPEPQIATLLHMEEDEFAYYLCRTHLLDDVPLAVEYVFLPIALVPGLRRHHAEGSLQRYVEHELELRVTSVHQVLEAVLPSQGEQTRLGVDARTALLSVRQVAFLADGRPLCQSRMVHAPGYVFRSVNVRS